MTTFYLIDFENVNADGLTGIERLGAEDRVRIYFTKHANKIDMGAIANHGKCVLEMTEVPAGKQAVDMHISSFLGYIIGRNRESDFRVVIVSRDTDFDKVVAYWQKTFKVERVPRIIEFLDPKTAQESQKKPAPAKETAKPAPIKPEPKTAPAADSPKAAEKTEPAKPAEKKAPAAPSIDSKTRVNNALMQALAVVKYDNKKAGELASKVIPMLSGKNAKQQIYRAIISACGQKQGLEVYTQIKGILA